MFACAGASVGVGDALGDAVLADGLAVGPPLGDAVGEGASAAQPDSAMAARTAPTTKDENLVPLRAMPNPRSKCSPGLILEVDRGGRTRHGYRGGVTRIIAGRAGSIVLDVPDAGTRPTSDRVRESLFGALESSDALHGAAVLDLYAGSGALALEAVSRGATSADLVEKSARAATIAQRNAARVGKAVGPDASIRVHRSSVDAFLRTARGPFDVVFLDPPYDVGETELASTLSLLAPLLAPGADVIVERSSRSPQPSLPAALTATRGKRYGDTALWWSTTSD
jgi:16S rRNA (guanine966-N2)-methyltransferase